MNYSTVATVHNDDGSLYDKCWTWEAGQNYSNQGYRVIAIRSDGHMTKEECQALYDYERKLAADCFGPGIRECD